MKYIMLKHERPDGLTQKLPLIFPDNLTHLQVFEAIRKLDGINNAQVVSAGYVGIDHVIVHGKSHSLGLYSDPNDENTIQDFEYFHGMEI